MDDKKKPSEPSETECWAEGKVTNKLFLQADAVYKECHSIHKMLRQIQLVQVIQGVALLFIALSLLLK